MVPPICRNAGNGQRFKLPVEGQRAKGLKVEDFSSPSKTLNATRFPDRAFGPPDHPDGPGCIEEVEQPIAGKLPSCVSL